jgi:hypothetical protein
MTPDQAALLRKAHSSLHAAQLLAGETLFDFGVSSISGLCFNLDPDAL